MLRLTFCGIALLASTLTAQAAKVPVEAFPANSALVIRVADVDKTTVKLKELVEAVEPAQAEMASATVGGMSGTIIDNPAKLGVKKGTDWWFAAIAEKGSPKPVLIIAVESDDVAAVKDAVGDAYTYVEYENWLLYSRDAEAMKAVQACVDGKAENVSKAADMKAQMMIMKADVGIFINIQQIASQYQGEIEAARDNIDVVLDAAVAEAQGAAVPGIDMAAIMDFYSDLAKSLLDSVKDLDGCLIAMSVSKEGIQFDEYLAVKKGSATSKFLSGSQPDAMQNFAKLPANEVMYAGISLDMAKMTKWSIELMSKFFGENAAPEVEVDDVIQKLSALDMKGYVSSFGLGDVASGLFRVAAIYDVNDTSAAKEAFQGMFKMVSNIDTPVMKQTMTYEDSAETIDGQAVDKMTLKQEFPTPEGADLNPQQAQAKQMQQMAMQMMYGPEGAVSRMAYLKKQVLATTGGGTEAMSALMKSAASPATSPAMDATRSKLGAEANIIILFDLPSLVAQGVEQASQFGLLPPGALSVDGIKPSYLGYALSFSESGLDAKAHIPAAQLQGLYQLGMQGFMMFQQLQGQ
ncbi:hypothetical protein OAF24_03460 [bacterium]|jgi:hypothetical protein|nr:hypothetical protein [bacterium]